MNREIEVYDFFNEFLDNLETRKIICSLILWFNSNTSEYSIRKNFDKNYLLCVGGNPPSHYTIKIDFDYWYSDKKDLKKYILPQLNIFSKDEYFNVFKFLKNLLLEQLKPIQKKFIDIFKNNEFIKEMYIISLNNILKKNYDILIEKSNNDINFIMDDNYNTLINNNIKNILIDKLTLPKKEYNHGGVYHRRRGMMEYNKTEYFEKLFKKNDVYYYKIFYFSFNNINIDDYNLYIEIFNLLLKNYNKNYTKQKEVIDKKKEKVIKEKKEKQEKKEKKEKVIKEKIKKKKPIPPLLKIKVWNKHIGDVIGKTKCLCCKLQDIYQASFSCGHIIAESNGGELKLNNLKPICSSCNSSMGPKNMDDYIEEFGF